MSRSGLFNGRSAGIRMTLESRGTEFRTSEYASLVKLAHQTWGTFDLLPVDGEQLISYLYAGLGTRTRWIDAVRDQAAAVFDPPHAVIGNRRLTLFFEVETGKDHGRHCEQEQQDRDKASLAFPIHGLRYWPRAHGGLRCGSALPLVLNEQVRCHPSPHLRVAKSSR